MTTPDSPTEPQLKLFVQLAEVVRMEPGLSERFDTKAAADEAYVILENSGLTQEEVDELTWKYYNAGAADNPLVFSAGLQTQWERESNVCYLSVYASQPEDEVMIPGIYTTAKMVSGDENQHVSYIKMTETKSLYHDHISTVIEFGTRETQSASPIGSITLTLAADMPPRIVHRQAQITPPAGNELTTDEIPSHFIKKMCTAILAGEPALTVMNQLYMHVSVENH